MKNKTCIPARLTLECFCSARKANKNHEKFDSDIIKTCAKTRVFARGEVRLAGVGIVPRVGLTAGAGFLFAVNRVAAENRFRRLRMRRNGARPSDSPTLLNNAVENPFWFKAGCNRSRRNKASLGSETIGRGDSNVKRTTDMRFAPNESSPDFVSGGGFARSLPQSVYTKT